MIFLDSNIVIELLVGGSQVTPGWAEATFAELAAREPLGCNLIVVAEVAAGLADADTLVAELSDMAIDIAELDLAAAMRASVAFREYRRRGGPRETILPDFLIAAHAETLGARLMTRDRRLASYFPQLSLITPETDPDG